MMWPFCFIVVCSLLLPSLSEGTTLITEIDDNMNIQWTMDPVPPSTDFVRVLHPSGNVLFSALGTGVLDPNTELSKRVTNTDNTNTLTGHIEFTLTGITLEDAGEYRAQYNAGSAGAPDINQLGVTLSIFVTPTKPNIIEEASPIVDNTMVLQCMVTSNSKPDNHGFQMNYKWYTNGTDLPDTDRYNTTGSHFQMKNIQKTDENTILTCRAYETLKLPSAVSNSYAIVPEYKPDNIAFEPSNPQQVIFENDALGPITCSADCNPTCQYRWIHNGTHTTLLSVLMIEKVKRDDNGIYVCIAWNEHGELRSRDLYLDVHYGPYNVLLTPNNTSYVLVENIRDTLGPVICSSECHSECTYTWTWNNIVLDSQKGVLTIDDVKRDKAGTYTCIATNRGRLNKTTNIEVKIEYGPGMILLLPSVTSYILLDKNTTLPAMNCTADCRPTCTYEWRLDGQKIDSNLMANSHTANRAMAGKYQCYTKNIYDTSYIIIDVVVQYAPDIPTLTKSIQGDIMEHQSVSLFCIAESVPLPDISIISQEADGKINVSQGSLNNSLTIQKAECLDTGEYTCDVINKFGKSLSDPVMINVMCIPHPDHRVSIEKNLYKDEDESLIIMASIIANPAPALSWTFRVNDTHNTTLENNVNGFILYENSKHVTYTSHVSKQKLRSDDYGQYTLRASNLFGNTEVSFNVIAKQPLHTESVTSAVVVGGAVGGSLGFIIVIIILVFTLHLKCREQKEANTYESLAERTEEERMGNEYDHVTRHAVSYIQDDMTNDFVNEYVNIDANPNMTPPEGYKPTKCPSHSQKGQ